MLKNYFKIAFRNLWKKKAFSGLNIFGLAIGITCASFILLWVEDELSFNRHIEDSELVFSIPTNQKYNGEWSTFFQATPGPLAGDLKKEIPEIGFAARLRGKDFLFNVKDNSIKKNGAYADPDIFEILSFNFLEGSARNAFKKKYSIVITQQVAIALFGKSTDVLGKSIEVDKETNFEVTGLIEDLPNNSTISLSCLIPFKNFTDGKTWTKSYDNNFTDTYVKLVSEADVSQVNEKVKGMIPAKTGGVDTQAILHASQDWYLRSTFRNGKIIGGRIEYVRLFSFVAIIILLIGCINFMNLSTARSEKRASEVGVRKTLGSGKKQLIFQFLTEALLTASIATILSILLLTILLPYFNALTAKQLTIDILYPIHLLTLLSITLVCGIVAGIYPAFYLSSFNPVTVLKGSLKKDGSASFIRKGLVITQFAVSIIFIVSTIVVYQQVQHIKNRDLGLDKNNLIEIPVSQTIIKNKEPLQASLTTSGKVKSVGFSNSNALSAGNNGSGLKWKGGFNTEDVLVSYRHINKDYFKTVGIELIEGKGFSSIPEKDSASVIISESLANLMGEGSAIGKTINQFGDLYTVKGVAADYLYGDMYGDSDPVIFFNYVGDSNYMYLRSNPQYATSEILSSIQKILETYNPGYPFEYRFVDEAFNARFKSEQLMGSLSQIFALLAILISCLGLFGLSAYTAEQRRKEIGVRKVLGSSVAGIVRLLSKEFIMLVFIAIAIAIPLAWWVMSNWLQSFAYRISISWWIFAIAGSAAIFIALMTVSFQAIKAAIANPVKSLRTE